MPELPAMAPISRNIGMAESSQLAANTNGVSLRALNATLKLRRYQKPANAAAPIATPIGTRSPISSRMPARLVSDSASVLSVAPFSGFHSTSDIGEHAQNEVDRHEGAGDGQQPAGRPDRQIHSAGEPHLAGTRALNCRKKSLVGEHRDIDGGQKLDR